MCFIIYIYAFLFYKVFLLLIFSDNLNSSWWWFFNEYNKCTFFGQWSIMNTLYKKEWEKYRHRNKHMIQKTGCFSDVVWLIKYSLLFFLYLKIFIPFFFFFLVTLQVLYKLKTSKVFEKSRNKDEAKHRHCRWGSIRHSVISWCPESRMLCIAGVSAHVIIYRFSKQEVITEVILGSSLLIIFSVKCLTFKFSNHLEDYL